MNTSWFLVCVIKWLVLIFAYILEKNQGQCLEWEGGGESSNIFFFF